MNDSKKRFGDRVDNYRRYRPSYPLELFDFVKKHCCITMDWTKPHPIGRNNADQRKENDINSELEKLKKELENAK